LKFIPTYSTMQSNSERTANAEHSSPRLHECISEMKANRKRIEKKLCGLEGTEFARNIKPDEIVHRMKQIREDLKSTLGACNHALASTDHYLEDYHREMPSAQLSEKISIQFRLLTLGKRPGVDRSQVRDFIAKFSRQPSEEEVEQLLSKCAHEDTTRLITQSDLEMMVRERLGLAVGTGSCDSGHPHLQVLPVVFDKGSTCKSPVERDAGAPTSPQARASGCGNAGDLLG